MRGSGGGRFVHTALVAVAGALTVALTVALVACGAPEAEPIAVPTFPSPAGQAGPAGPGGDDGALPDDCGRIFAPADLEALLGLPLGSVGVRTTLGVPQPSVGRTERVSCDYTRAGGPGKGRFLLDLNASAYVDPAAARGQWQVNVDAEPGDHRDVPIGAASAVLIERRGEAVLMVAHAASNLTLVLPDQPLPGGRSRGDVLVDLALRVLPAVSVVPTNAQPDAAPSDAGAAPTVGAAG